MAEAPNILLLLTLSSCLPDLQSIFTFIDILIAVSFLTWAHGQAQHFLHHATKHDKSLRKDLRQQRRHLPKAQFRYHWFKSRMKRKKSRKFRKPPPLLHLTWKWKFWKLFIMTALTLYKVCCYMEHSFTSSLKQAHYFATLFRSFLLQTIPWRCTQQHARHCAFFSTLDSSLPNPVCSRFDTDSFKIGVDTLCSVTMSPRKECFQDLKPVEGATVNGIAGGIVANA